MTRAGLLLMLVACGEASPRVVTVTVDPTMPVAEVSPRYLSVAVDMAQVVGGTFWDPDGGQSTAGDVQVDPYDFARPRLRTLAQALAPAYLRIGGTEADRTFYDLSDTPVTTAPDGYQWVLTRAMWDGIVEFATTLDYRLFVTLDAGPGPRVDGAWQPTNARVLVDEAARRGDPVDIWELGNEINGFLLIHELDLTPVQYASDLATARAMLDVAMPDSKLAGPSSAFWPEVGEFTDVSTPTLAAGGGEHLDLITWHYYPQQSRRCPAATRRASPETMLDPANLDEVQIWAAHVTDGRDRYAPDVPIWLGETGNAQCGGEPGVSDAFAGTFWWLDQLGSIARLGQPVTVRQTLSGSNYGLIDDVTLEPNPDYWVSVLWRRLMGERVLAVTLGDPGAPVRAYAHCTPGRTGATLLIINLSSSEPIVVRAPELAGPAHRYLVTAAALDARELVLEGTPLAVAADGGVPALAGTAVAGAELELPPTSWAFLTSDTPLAACE